MTYVSDPDLISRLNAKAGMTQPNNAVTDPDLINRLNQQAGFNSNDNNDVKNLISQIPTAASQKQSALDAIIPKYAQSDLRTIGSTIPLAATSGIPGLLGLGARLGAGVGAGALMNPDNAVKGAETGLGFSALGEAAPAALSGIGKIAELINPVKYAGKLGNQIQNTYQTLKTQASGIYNDLKDRYADSNIYQIGNKIPSINYLMSDKKDMSYLMENSALKKMHNNFIQDPSYRNAHELQSQMGSYMRDLSGNTDANTNNTISAIRNLQSNLRDDMGSYLKNVNPVDYANYQTARGITRDVVKPTELNNYVAKVAQGKIKDVDPNDLLTGLKNANESGKLPDNHFLRPIMQDLSNRVKRGQTYNDLGSLLGGAALGETLMPGGMGASAGIGAGALMAKAVNPVAIRLAQNPYFVNALGKLGKGYDFARNYLISENLKQ